METVRTDFAKKKYPTEIRMFRMRSVTTGGRKRGAGGLPRSNRTTGLARGSCGKKMYLLKKSCVLGGWVGGGRGPRRKGFRRSEEREPCPHHLTREEAGSYGKTIG